MTLPILALDREAARKIGAGASREELIPASSCSHWGASKNLKSLFKVRAEHGGWRENRFREPQNIQALEDRRSCCTRKHKEPCCTRKHKEPCCTRK